MNTSMKKEIRLTYSMQSVDVKNDCLTLEDENLMVVTVCKAGPQPPQSGAGVLEGPAGLLAALQATLES